MIPQYQFNVGYDPLLDPNNISDFNTYRQQLEQRIQQLNDIKQNISQNISQNNQQQVVNNSHLIDELDKELSSLTNDQKSILSQDKTYVSFEQQLQIFIQQELINSVKYKVVNTQKGKELVEKQLAYIKSKKDEIIAESNKEAEMFKQFQLAAQKNPNITYAEFCKSIKE